MAEVCALGGIGIEDFDQSLDVIGFLCPIPVARTRDVLKAMEAGQFLELWVDDPETLEDIPALLARTGDVLVGIEGDAGEYRFIIKAGGQVDG